MEDLSGGGETGSGDYRFGDEEAKAELTCEEDEKSVFMATERR